MKTTRTELIEKQITTYSCDFCNFKTENNSGCCGHAPIMTCSFCNKDICGDCRHELYEDDYDDYYQKLIYCPVCAAKALEAWDNAHEIARYGADIFELTMKIFKGEEI